MRILLTILCLGLGMLHAQKSIKIGPEGDFQNLEQGALIALPGDTLLLLNGSHHNGTQFIEELHGTEDGFIHIKAEEQGSVILSEGTEAIHFINCSYIIIDGLIIEGQTGNGINIDDGGDYTSPAHHFIIRNCIFRDMNASGNNDLLKLSGLDSFRIEYCEFLRGGGGGSGIDMVGCHAGEILNNYFEEAGASGIQAKGGTSDILIQGNILKNMSQRAVNLGGSTGLEFFRPPLPDPIENAYEAANIDVVANVFIGSWSPIAYVGSVNVRVMNNTIYKPENWVIRILQETTEPGFLPCSNNEFKNNIIYLEEDITEINIGPNVDTSSFEFSHNLWYNESDENWEPNLYTFSDPGIIIADPLFENRENEIYELSEDSPAVGSGISWDGMERDFEGKKFGNPPARGAYEVDISSGHLDIKYNKPMLFPNPASSRIFFQVEGFMKNIRISDIKGKIIPDFKINHAEKFIDISTLPSGFYILIIKTQNGEIIDKFLKY